MMVHHWIWEQKTGEPVPEGHYVRFKNGDKWDWRFSNLELISTTEHAKLPTMRTPKVREGKKQCTECGKWKPLDEFHRAKRVSDMDARHSECRDCHAQYLRESRANDRNYRKNERARGRQRRDADRKGYNAYHRDYYRRKRAEKLADGGKLVRVRWRGRKWCKGHLTREQKKWKTGEEATTLCGKVIPFSERTEFANGKNFPIECKACQKACLLTLGGKHAG
jgi:hypothetical protein